MFITYATTLVFSDTTNKLGLLQDCEMRLFGDNGYGQITSNPNRLLQFTARINRRQDRFVQLAISADGRWQYDDTNNTDYPEATTAIVSGQRDYPLDVSMMEIESISILGSANTSNYTQIYAIDVTDGSGLSRSYIENNPSGGGMPCAYDKTANSIIFNVNPNYSAPLGIKVRFKRGTNYFISTNTTQVPGFPALFHDYLSAGASLDYAVDRNMTTQISTLGTVVLAKEDAILDFFSKRSKDEQKIIRSAYRTTR